MQPGCVYKVRFVQTTLTPGPSCRKPFFPCNRNSNSTLCIRSCDLANEQTALVSFYPAVQCAGTGDLFASNTPLFVEALPLKSKTLFRGGAWVSCRRALSPGALLRPRSLCTVRVAPVVASALVSSKECWVELLGHAMEACFVVSVRLSTDEITVTENKTEVGLKKA